MKALIVGAGQGKRLLPLTKQEPKALLKIGGKSLLEWQIESLVTFGITEIVVIAGFNLGAVERALDAFGRRWPDTTFRVVYNPFYGVADNLASCWMARHEMIGDFLLLNSDTLFSRSVLKILLASRASSISLAIDQKPQYDEDDMKVELDGSRLTDIGKTLPVERVHGESIGMLYFRGDGPQKFAEALEHAMREPTALRQWYLSIIAALAPDLEIQAVNISGNDWCEIDFPADVENAERMVAAWGAGPDDDMAAADSS